MGGALAWSAVERMGQQGIQLLVSLVMARLLLPEEYGLMGIVAMFVGISCVLSEAGLSACLVQQRDITQRDQTTAFWLSVSLGLAMTVVLWLMAPVIATFFRQGILVDLIRVASLQVLFASCSVVQTALLTKEMDFRAQAIAGAGGTVLSGALGIALAWVGYGAWSLVLQVVARSGFISIGLWMLRPWRPSGRPVWDSVRKL